MPDHRPADGVILLDKPAGMTSHDLVLRVRRGLREAGAGTRGPGRARAGHAGTLDPFATGLLLVLTGRATRVQRFLMALPKTYQAVGRFGAVSSTGDPEGEIVATGAVPEGDLELPTGVVRQRPPAHSAVKVGGQRAYRLARRGEPVATREREVTVHAFRELWRDGDRRGFEIVCSSGTYVRSLIGDLGDAYCEALRRTAIGPFAVAQADPQRVLALEQALGFLPERRLDAVQARRARHGAAVPGQAEGPVRLTGPDGLIAVAEPRAGGLLAPVAGLWRAD